MVSVAVSACVAVVACACGSDSSEEDSDAKQSKPSASAPAEEPSAEPSASPSASAGTETPSASPAGDQPAPRTKERAIERYELFLHAVGGEDVDTICEVAGPAAKQAEDEGFGPCESTFVAVFQMIPPEKKEALKTATVDPQGVDVLAPDKVEIPAAAVRASVTFTESEIGSSTMEYLEDDWFVTD